MIGGQAGLVGHIQVADGSKINAQSGVSKSMKEPYTRLPALLPVIIPVRCAARPFSVTFRNWKNVFMSWKRS
jgi:UDP-3-O-[3-hydroxymyristoyl] glucosamine N-acyltransferase